MTIYELKKELGLSNKDIAEFFGLTPAAYANSSAKPRYESALCFFYEFLQKHSELPERQAAKLIAREGEAS